MTLTAPDRGRSPRPGAAVGTRSAGSTPPVDAPRSTPSVPPAARGSLLAAALVAGIVSTLVALAGIGIPAADRAKAAVDEPQYLLSAISLVEDGDLDISDERGQGRARPFHSSPLPVQTAVQADGQRISPHDPLLPVLLTPAVLVAPTLGLPAWVAAKALLALLAGALAAATAWVLGTRWAVPPALAAAVAAVVGASTPIAVYGHQVYPEVAAALAVVAGLAAVVPSGGSVSSLTRPFAAGRHHPRVLPAVALVVAVSALPWLSVKYTLVAAALAAVGLARQAQTSRRLAAASGLALALSATCWFAVHHRIYGGWTAYAAGDHFQSRGEFSAVGFAPDLLGRSTRWVGLFTDRDYGLMAWQPAWLLVVPALGILWGLSRRPAAAPQWSRWDRLRHRALHPSDLAVLTAPLAAGVLTAVYVALTMHGFWWPGRQVVVVLPLAAMLLALALAHPLVPHRRAWAGAAAALAVTGLGIHAWVLAAGYGGGLTWVGAPDVVPPAPLALMRSVLPDYRDPGPMMWWGHALWACVLLLLLFGTRHAGTRLASTPGDR